MEVRVRNVRLSDIPQIRKMEERVWKETPATEEMLISRINAFPEGNIIAEVQNENVIVGYLSVIFINYDLISLPTKTWAELTDNGYCNISHNIKYPVMLGVNMTVDESFQKQGVAANLFISGWTVGLTYDKVGCLLGARCPEYHKYADKMSIKEYVQKRREDGKAFDPEIRLYEREGWKLLGLVPDYIQDKESCNYGAIMYLKNPFFGYPSIIRRILAILVKKFGPRFLGL